MRFDHTDWLIHFVRNRKPEQDFPGKDEDTALRFAGGELEFDADAFSVLLTVIRVGGIFPGHSFRNGRTTIYGGQPAICATEMPIYSFSKYVRERGKADVVSAYGIAFLKTEFYAAGGRPVIYGFSSDNVSYQENTSFSRVFDEAVLPKHEQFRYVAYSLSRDKWIDWSHEREWRWIARDKTRHRIWAKGGSNQCDFIPGLPLFAGEENEGYFSRVGIIVWSNEEAARIQKELTGYYLAQSNNYDSPFSPKLLRNSFIIVLDDIIKAVEVEKRLEAQTIEGIETGKLLKTVVLCENTDAHEPDIRETIVEAKAVGKTAATIYLSKHPLESGSCGYASIISYNVTHPIIQQILKMDVASGPFDGKVVIYIHGDWATSQSINYNEHIAAAMCEVFNVRLGRMFYCETRLD